MYCKYFTSVYVFTHVFCEAVWCRTCGHCQLRSVRTPHYTLNRSLFDKKINQSIIARMSFTEFHKWTIVDNCNRWPVHRRLQIAICHAIIPFRHVAMVTGNTSTLVKKDRRWLLVFCEGCSVSLSLDSPPLNNRYL